MKYSYTRRSLVVSTPMEPSASNNVYFNDPESGAEMARLIDQDRLVTRGMGGPLTGLPELSSIHRILDVACGPGGWAQEVGFAYPEIEVVGIEISQAMIGDAGARAK